MNKRLVERAMKKLGDQTAIRNAQTGTQSTTTTLPTTLPTAPASATFPPTVQATVPNTGTLIGSSAAAEEAMAARIRADIARADALRRQRAQERAAATPSPTVPTLTQPVVSTTPNPARPAPQPPAVHARPAAAPQPALLQASEHNLARFDFEDLESRGFLVPDNKTAKIHQEFRLIKRRLLDNAFGRLRPVVDKGRLMMVTSSLPGEGKTFSAINLAISIAIGGEHPVLLVDADIARPNVANTLRLDVSGKNGLTDYLDDPSLSLADMLMRTSVPNLTLLLAGQQQHHPVDLLASSSMAALVDTLKTQLPHHVIIFDSPPLLPVTETRSLSALVGQVLLVVAAGDTPRSAVNEALIQLENCEAVGMLFNKAPAQPSAPAYYGY